MEQNRNINDAKRKMKNKWISKHD